MYVSSVGTKSAESFSVNAVVNHMKWERAEQLPVSVTTSFSVKFLNETVDLELLAALEQFEDQAANRLLIAVLDEYDNSGATQKKDVKKTPAKMLPSTLTKHCM